MDNGERLDELLYWLPGCSTRTSYEEHRAHLVRRWRESDKDGDQMIGWNISVYRKNAGGQVPATTDSERGPRLAVWQADGSGLDWLEDLVKDGRAIDLGGNGYPLYYTAQAQHVLSCIRDRPPHARELWVTDPWDLIGDGWEGKTVIDRAAIDNCRPDEWLLVVAWDES